MKSRELQLRRRGRVRSKLLKRRNISRPRLSVHRTNLHIYVQVIDDVKGTTLAAASTLDKDFKSADKSGANLDAAKAVGTLIATRAKAAGVTEVVFDRSGYLFHGRIKALADAAREAGLAF